MANTSDTKKYLVILDIIFIVGISVGLYSKQFILSTLLSIFFLAIFAFVVEKHHIGRMSILQNVVIVAPVLGFAYFASLFDYWILFGVVLGTIGIVTYVYRKSIGFLHNINYAFFGSKTVLALYITSIFFKTNEITFWLLFLSLLITIWVSSVEFLEHKYPFDTED